MTKTLNINFAALEYLCEKPSAKVRSKKLWPIIKFGRLIEEYSNPDYPAIRDYKEDLKRVTSYFYFDHTGSYIQISKCLRKVLSFNLDKNEPRQLEKNIVLEQHCFDQLTERKVSPKSVVEALKLGNHVLQYCLDRRTQKLYKNMSFFYKDLRVVVSILDGDFRVKTAYRLTDISDKNLMKKITDNQKAISLKRPCWQHDYAVVDLDALYQSSLIANKEGVKSKTEMYQPAWELLGNTFGLYQSLLSKNNGKVRSNETFERNQNIVDSAIMQSSLKNYRHKSFEQIDYDPKKEYGLIFFYEKNSFLSIAKRIYGLGLSAKIVYKAKKVDAVTKDVIMMVGCSLTATSGHEWIKSSDRKELISIDTNSCNV